MPSRQPKARSLSIFLIKNEAASLQDILLSPDFPSKLRVTVGGNHLGDLYVDPTSGLNCSLYLLHVKGIKLRVFAPGAGFGNRKRRVQADFSYKGVNYSLWVTDPIIERDHLSKKDGEYKIGECYVTVSLGESHEGYCYKLVATIISA